MLSWRRSRSSPSSLQSGEVERHLENLQWALEAAGRELGGGEARQAFNKVFLAWKEAVAAAAALAALLEEEVARRLSTMEPSPIQDGRIVVTTANAPKALRVLRDACSGGDCPEELRRLIEELWRARQLAYQLHYAYYEGPEHAGFADEGEASASARSLLGSLARIHGVLSRLRAGVLSA